MKQLKTAVLDFYATLQTYVEPRIIYWKLRNRWNPTFVCRMCHWGATETSDLLNQLMILLLFWPLDLDEKLKLNCLPRYVSVSLYAMPSIRIYGDLQSIMIAFNKLRNRMDQNIIVKCLVNSTVVNSIGEKCHNSRSVKRLRWDRGDLLTYYTNTGQQLQSIFMSYCV